MYSTVQHATVLPTLRCETDLVSFDLVILAEPGAPFSLQCHRDRRNRRMHQEAMKGGTTRRRSEGKGMFPLFCACHFD